MISYRELLSDDLDRIAEIDRAEEIYQNYVVRSGELALKDFRVSVLEFDKSELEVLIAKQKSLFESGGMVVGAFDEEKLIGVASVENHLRGRYKEYVKMDILYISANYRGRGIGKTLIEKSKIIASEFGADKLYVSATPTKNTVDFYMKNGAELVKELDTELFEEEPVDIHLELNI